MLEMGGGVEFGGRMKLHKAVRILINLKKLMAPESLPMQFLLRAIFFPVMVLLAGCTSNNNPGSSDKGDEPNKPIKHTKPSHPSSIHLVPSSIKFDADVDADRAQALSEAVSFLYLSPMLNNDTEVSHLLKVSDTRPSTLQAWLEERVAFVVDEDFDIMKSARFVPGTYQYENPEQIPEEWNERLMFSQFGSDVKDTIMLNLSGSMYLVGKQNQVLVQVDIAGFGQILITSPRVGLLKIGSGMFTALTGSSFETDKIFQAGTLFHEARHSDGHGLSTGFAHTLCPMGHKYQGKAACDRSLNGAYTVGAAVQKSLMDNCSNCDQSSLHELRSIFLDISSRVIKGEVTLPTTPPKKFQAHPVNYDDAPEGHR